MQCIEVEQEGGSSTAHYFTLPRLLSAVKLISALHLGGWQVESCCGVYLELRGGNDDIYPPMLPVQCGALWRQPVRRS